VTRETSRVESQESTLPHSPCGRLDHRALVAVRLRESAKLQGLESTRAIARATGLSIGAIRSLLKGETDPTLGTMLAIVEGLGLSSVEELLRPLGTSVALGRSPVACQRDGTG
jgi:transcriptional regulator with XRE-family HTH domain